MAALMEAIEAFWHEPMAVEDTDENRAVVAVAIGFALAHSEPRPVAGREDMARLIDPEAFEPTDNFDLRHNRDMRRAEAFSAADRVLATHSPAATEAGEVVGYLHKHFDYYEEFDKLPLTEGDKAAGWTETPLYALSSTQGGAER